MPHILRDVSFPFLDVLLFFFFFSIKFQVAIGSLSPLSYSSYRRILPGVDWRRLRGSINANRITLKKKKNKQKKTNCSQSLFIRRNWYANYNYVKLSAPVAKEKKGGGTLMDWISIKKWDPLSSTQSEGRNIVILFSYSFPLISYAFTLNQASSSFLKSPTK